MDVLLAALARDSFIFFLERFNGNSPGLSATRVSKGVSNRAASEATGFGLSAKNSLEERLRC